MYSPKFILFVCLIYSGSLLGQDSLKKDLMERLDIDLFGGGYYQAKLSSREITLPDYIKNQRNVNISTASDNPLFHGAYFFGLHTQVDFMQGASFHADFIGEHRGFSYGVYNTENMIVYPRAEFVMDKTVILKTKPLRLFISIGNKTNFDFYEGLTLYNIDAQGWKIFAQWGKFRMSYYQLSDLDAWIGLNIGDSFDNMYSLEGISLIKGWKSDLKAGWYSYNSGAIITDFTGVKFSSNFYKDDLKLYFQIGSRFDGNESAKRKSAFVIGAKDERKYGKLLLKSTLEYRYYGSYFNLGYQDTFVNYRNPSGGVFANTIGDNLYPLSLYDRPFAQWAVFTEYQDQNVAGLVLQTDLNYSINYGLFTRLNLDVNWIKAEQEQSFIYPFYTLLFGWEPSKNNYFSIGLTNKGMNLDVYYPTYYLYRKPFFHVAIKRRIENHKDH